MIGKTTSLKVIGDGLSRSGTLSLKTALELLVGSCYHGTVPTLEKHKECLFCCILRGLEGVLDEVGEEAEQGGKDAFGEGASLEDLCASKQKLAGVGRVYSDSE